MNERHFALDNLCHLAARATGATTVIVIEWTSRLAAQIRGATGSNVRKLTGNSRIPRLHRSERPIVVYESLRAEAWFKQHALQTVDPYAKVLIAADIAVPGSQSEAALVAINPSSRPQRDESTIALFSELASIAGFLLAAVNSVDSNGTDTAKVRTYGGQEARVGFQDAGKDGEYLSMAEPLLFFLRKTLIKRRALRARKSVHYITLRQWKESVKDAQIAALRAIKSRPTKEAVRLIGLELAEAVRELYPGMQLSCVVPVPCGSSMKESCLSTSIGEAVADILSLPLKSALRGESTHGASHPYKSAKMKAYELVEDVSGNVLLVDDVATTGTHITLAATVINSKGATALPVVWIAG